MVPDIARDCRVLRLLPLVGPAILPDRLDAMPVSACTVPSVETFDLDARSCLLPCQAEHMHDLLQPISFSCLQTPPSGLPAPGRFMHWVLQASVGRAPAPGEVVTVTTDGSYDPVSGNAGWAVVVSLVAGQDFRLPGQLVGCMCGSLSEVRDAVGQVFGPFDAYLAEVAALFWGALLSLKLPGGGQWLFRADNISALRGVEGAMRLRKHPLCGAASAVHTAFRLSRHTPAYQHVAGHANDPANELADALAGWASRAGRGFRPFSVSLRSWFADDGLAFAWLPHMCITQRSPDSLPVVANDVMTWSRGHAQSSAHPADSLRPFLRACEGSGPPSHVARPCEMQLCLASFNALSLLDTDPSSHAAGLHGETGRVKLLCESLRSHGVDAAGIQECRTPRGSMACRGYCRFAAGRDANACYGVELWLAEDGIFDSSAVTVFHAEPTFLVAGVPFQGGSLRFLVAHGPHRAHTAAYRTEWWARVSGVCAAHARDSTWIILTDGNCRIGSVTSSGVGDFQADPEDDAGEAFRHLIDDLSCWVPATFAGTAQGEGGTLYQRRSGALDRSDFVAIPRAWQLTGCAAWVEPTVSAGHRCLDHFAVLVRCQLIFQDTFRRRARARRIDKNALLDPNNSATVTAILDTAPCFAWRVDASEHVSGLVDHIYRGLAAAFPQTRRRMFSVYMAWSPVFGTPRGHVSMRFAVPCFDVPFLLGNNVLSLKLFGVGGGCGAFAFATLWIACYLGGSVFSCAVSAGRTACSICLRLLTGFHRQLSFEGTDTVDAASIPTWEHLCQAFKHTSPHKASGPDMIPPALCTVYSQKMTEVFWPVMMKAVLRANEAIGLKGGLLHRIAKPSAVDNTTSGYRGILVQSCLSKALHRAVRHLAVHHWHGHALPLQVGGRQGCPADFGHFCSRAFLSYTKANHVSAAILFVDLSALGRRDRSAYREHVPCVPWSGVRSPWCSARTQSLRCAGVETSDVVYADDLASFLCCSGASAMLTALSCAVSDTVDTMLPHGLNANVGPTKTAAIISPAGAGSREVRRQCFSVRQGRIPIIPENRGGFKLDLVPSYKHLGSFISHNGCMQAEIRHRLASGRAALKEGKSRLFACKREWRLFAGGVMSMYRQLLCLRTEGGFRCTMAQIVSRVGLPHPSALLHSHRLRFLGQLVRNGPDPAWALLAHYDGFKTGNKAASDWFLAAVGQVCPLGDIEQDWASWEVLFRQTPGRFKSLLKRADAWHLIKYELEAALDEYVREFWPSAVDPARVASLGRLRTHLRLSLACVQAIDRLATEGPVPVDLSVAHELAPAIPGVGKSALGAVAPETLPPLAAALAALDVSGPDADTVVYDTIVSHVAPLPVLRNTLAQWIDGLPNGDLRAAAEDVLLVLRPEHLCERVSGPLRQDTELQGAFRPHVLPPVLKAIDPSLPCVFVGPLVRSWAHLVGVASLEMQELRLSELAYWPWHTASAACVAFLQLPKDDCPVFSPPSCTLRAMRELRDWTFTFLSALRPLIALAQA
ncbi:unnamed protein product, partial [Symbiodinium sp. CCMP2456]